MRCRGRISARINVELHRGMHKVRTIYPHCRRTWVRAAVPRSCEASP